MRIFGIFTVLKQAQAHNATVLSCCSVNAPHLAASQFFGSLRSTADRTELAADSPIRSAAGFELGSGGV